MSVSDFSADVRRRVSRIIITALEVDAHGDALDPETDIIHDLGADSLDIVEIVMALEEEFDVVIDEINMEHLTEVGAIYAHIDRDNRAYEKWRPNSTADVQLTDDEKLLRLRDQMFDLDFMRKLVADGKVIGLI